VRNLAKSEEIIPIIKKKTIEALLEKNTRIDGKKLDEYREISVEFNVIEKAEGSAIVNIGNTMVIAGVKSVLGKPFPDTPDEGVLIVNTELIPLASPTFEPGPPGEDDIEIARVVDRGIRSAEVVDLKKLCIVSGKSVWALYIDIYALNHDGNLMDASGLAAYCALLCTKIPKHTVENETVKIFEEKEELPIQHEAIPVTFAKIGEKIVVDPCYEEELIMDARLTISFNEEGKICAIQKGGRGMFTADEIMYCAELGRKISREISEKIKRMLENAQST